MERDYWFKSFIVSVVCLLASLASESLFIEHAISSSHDNTFKTLFIISFFVVLLWRIIISFKNKIN